MNQTTLADRVETLEKKMEGLSELPIRVAALESQIAQFRDEWRAELSATEGRLRVEMRALNEGVRAEMRETNEELRAQMRALNQETRTHMLVLHEDLVSRIAAIGEGLNGSPRSTRSKRR